MARRRAQRLVALEAELTALRERLAELTEQRDAAWAAMKTALEDAEQAEQRLAAVGQILTETVG